jgi:hypothetical protein
MDSTANLGEYVRPVVGAPRFLNEIIASVHAVTDEGV